jgi:hypothetical protein
VTWPICGLQTWIPSAPKTINPWGRSWISRTRRAQMRDASYELVRPWPEALQKRNREEIPMRIQVAQGGKVERTKGETEAAWTGTNLHPTTRMIWRGSEAAHLSNVQLVEKEGDGSKFSESAGPAGAANEAPESESCSYDKSVSRPGPGRVERRVAYIRGGLVQNGKQPEPRDGACTASTRAPAQQSAVSYCIRRRFAIPDFQLPGLVLLLRLQSPVRSRLLGSRRSLD